MRLPDGHGGQGGEQGDLLGLVFGFPRFTGCVGTLDVVLPGTGQGVAPLLGDAGGVRPEPEIVGDEQVGALAPGSRCPAHDTAHGLAEEQLRGRRRRIDTDMQAGDVDPLGHHAHRDDPGVVPAGESGDAAGCSGVVGGDHGRPDPEAPAKQVPDPPGVLLVDGDHQPGGVGPSGPDRR